MTDDPRTVELHRPHSEADLVREIRRLLFEGWTVDGIAQALRIHPGAVRAALDRPRTR